LAICLGNEYNISSGKKWETKVLSNFAKYMLIGEYIHTIDEKNRISLPAKFRKEMGKVVIITPGLDKCLFIFTIEEWKKVSKKLSDSENDLSFLKADQRSFNRNMFGQAVDVEVDSIGRILIPENLKEKIKVSGKAALIGVQDRVEVWNDKVWSQVKKVAEKQADQLAEKLGSEGKF
jgi:MraZ protein